MDLLARVAATISKAGLLVPHETVIVGVSGGPDSLCLLDCLQRLDYRPVVAHLDHQLRADSWDDAEFVMGVARDYGLPMVIERRSVPRGDGEGSLEERARQVRYEFLARVAQERRCRAVAVGHTGDDQAETVLMHLLRGAGTTGLRGMLPLTPLDRLVRTQESVGRALVRPLLEITRQETEAYCASVGLKPRLDPSNRDPAFFRNRLRHELLPALTAYNPEIKDVLRRMAEVMAGEADVVAACVESIWPDVVRPAGESGLALLVGPLGAQSIGVQRAVLREVVSRLRPDIRDVGFEAVERMRGLLGVEGAPLRQTVVGGLEALRTPDLLVISVPGKPITLPEYPQVTRDVARAWRVPSAVRLACGWRLTAETQTLTPGRRRSLGRGDGGRLAAFDADRIEGGLRLRPPRPGDRIGVLGMQGSANVADLLASQHIPRPARARWPVVTAGDEVIWVAGLRMAHRPRLRGTSRRALVLRLLPPLKDR
jgi:tRNA(Ile)-lysidine synthase